MVNIFRRFAIRFAAVRDLLIKSTYENRIKGIRSFPRYKFYASIIFIAMPFILLFFGTKKSFLIALILLHFQIMLNQTWGKVYNLEYQLEKTKEELIEAIKNKDNNTYGEVVLPK